MSPRPRTSNDALSFHRIRASALSMKHHSAILVSGILNEQSAAARRKFAIPASVFPQPRPLTLDVDLGLDRAVSEKISSSYLQAATRLKAVYETRFRQACLDITKFDYPLCPDIERLQSTLVSGYTARLDAWIEQVKIYGNRILHARQRLGGANVHGQSRRSFSPHVVSILEAFFEQNAYPSRLQKDDLAIETKMKYTQIHVWFQNRRRRFRKEGKELRRGDLLSALPSELEISVIELLNSTKQDMNSGEQRIDPVNAPTYTFNSKGPLHAFPSAYPPACSYDPFPLETDARNFVTPWIRKSSSTYAGRSCDISVAQLTASFMKLALVEEAPSHTTQHNSTSDGCSSNILGFSIVAPRAPHPALIHPSVTILPMVLNEADARPSSFSKTDASCPQIVGSVNGVKPRRKVAPLPKRLPSDAKLARRGALTPVSHVYAWTTPDGSLSAEQMPPRGKVLAPEECSFIRPAVHYNYPPSSLQSVSAPFRTPSASSSTSSGTSSPSGPDTPLPTPPSLSKPLPISRTSTSYPLGSTPSFSSLFNESCEYSLAEGLRLQLEATARIVSRLSS